MIKKKISIIGGAGHIGLPLAVVLFDAGFEINIVDKDKKYFTYKQRYIAIL